MVETVTFPIGDCASCGPNKLLAYDLDEADELILVCIHCDRPLPAGASPRRLGALALQRLGYDVDGEIERRGCGSHADGGDAGGCGTCATSSCGTAAAS